MANPYPAIAICIAALGASLGAAVFASAAPSEERACSERELVAERFYAVEAPEPEGGRLASYYVELANPQSRAQVFKLGFEVADAQERRAGERAVSLAGQQNVPMLLGQQRLEGDAPALAPQAIAQAVRMHCRSW